MLKKFGPALLLSSTFLLLWELAVPLFHIPAFILPTPSQVGAALWRWRRVLFLDHLPVTLAEVAGGLAISLLIGVALAVAMHMWPGLGRALYPLVVVAQTVPVIAISPVFLFWFGYSLAQKIAVVVLVAFFPIVVNTRDGLRSVDAGLRTWLQAAGAGPWRILWLAEIPAALPAFFSGLKVAATVSVVGAVVGEWLGGQHGLGVYGRRAGSSLQSPELFASVVVLALMGVVLFLLVAALERRLTRWHGSARL